MSKLGKKQIRFTYEYNPNTGAPLQINKTYLGLANPLENPSNLIQTTSTSLRGVRDKELVIQKLEFIGPVGTQTILVPADFDITFSSQEDIASGDTKDLSQSSSPEGPKAKSVKQTILVKINNLSAPTPQPKENSVMLSNNMSQPIGLAIRDNLAAISHREKKNAKL